MKNLSFVFVAALSLAAFGCKKGGDCAKAISNGMEVGKAELPTDEKIKQKMRDIGVQHCKDDKWSDDVLKCMVEAKTEAEGQACYGKLSKEQQDKMNKAAMEMMPAGGAGSAESVGSAGSAAATGAGSAGDSGSAGSAAAPK